MLNKDADDQHLDLYVKRVCNYYRLVITCIRGQLLNSTHPINIEYVYQNIISFFLVAYQLDNIYMVKISEMNGKRKNTTG